jgi:hypothetical protein
MDRVTGIDEHPSLNAATRELHQSKLRHNIAGTSLGKRPLPSENLDLRQP